MTSLPITTLEIHGALDAVYIRQKSREIAELLGFERNDQTRIVTAVSEIVRNAWQYAGGGTVTFALVPGSPQIFQIQVEDSGPGIVELDAVLAGNGKGIFGARCVMDTFAIHTVLNEKTVVTMGKYLPRYISPIQENELTEILVSLRQRPPLDPLEELHRQNQDLLQTLRQLQVQQEDWERLYREMEITNRDMLTVHDELSEQNEALHRSEARFRQMIDEVKDYAIFLLDADGHVATWNIGAQRILGYSESDILGRSGEILFPPDYREANKPQEEMQTAREAGRAEEEHWYLRNDGSRFWANSVLTVLWNEGKLTGYVKILRDITERKETQDALQVAYERERHITAVLQSPLIQDIAEEALPGLSVITLYESALGEAEVGGDFFDAFPIESGEVALAVGDASGKGLSAALRAMQVKQLLRGAFTLVNDPSPIRVVTHLSRYLSQIDEAADTEQFDYLPGFVALALIVLDPKTGQGISIAAGCEPPLILRATGEAETLHGSDPPLGVLLDSEYKALSFLLEAGDTLVLTTDGITEARANRQLLGYEGMIELAQQGVSSPTLREMGQVILEGARTFAKGNLRDDACLLIARLS